jgi:hypothetical protein
VRWLEAASEAFTHLYTSLSPHLHDQFYALEGPWTGRD